MASKRRISTQWRIFLPLVLMLWVVIVSAYVWGYNRERDYRTGLIRQELTKTAGRIIASYETEGVELVPTINFLRQYYANDEMYDATRVSVYNCHTGDLIGAVGEPLPFNERDRVTDPGNSPGTVIREGAVENRDGEDGMFFFSVSHSHDNRIVVYTAMPYDATLASHTVPGSGLWIAFVIIGLAATFFALLTSLWVGKSVRMLRQIATRAAHDPQFIAPDHFPPDDLGDISRQIVHIFNDRTRTQAQIIAKHREAMKSEEEKNRLKREMTSNINHELKTPICIVKGYLDTIAQNPDMDADSRDHFLDKARSNIDRLTDMVKDISLLTRFDDGVDKVMTERIDMLQVALNVENDLREAGLLAGITPIRDIPPDVYVSGNFALLVGMVHNLAKNAIAYSKGNTMTFRYDGVVNDLYHRFQFYDDGVGVPPEALEHLFERFYCVETGRARKSAGTGLGLAIVQDTIHSLGGHIGAMLHPITGGLMFEFTLPIWHDLSVGNYTSTRRRPNK